MESKRQRPDAADTRSSSCSSSSTILLILASAVLPLAQVTSQRQREAELRRSLREMRTAIDKFKDAVDTGQIATTELKPGSEGYPPDLETLVEGVTAANDATGRKLKYPAADPDRSDDQQQRVGTALVPGQAGLDVVGRPERVRRVHEEPTARRSMERSTGTGRRGATGVAVRPAIRAAASRSSS